MNFLLKAEEEDKYSETERDSERGVCVCVWFSQCEGQS